jgi:hypothetical protein
MQAKAMKTLAIRAEIKRLNDFIGYSSCVNQEDVDRRDELAKELHKRRMKAHFIKKNLIKIV